MLFSLVAEPKRLAEPRGAPKSYPIRIENGPGSKIKEPGPFRQSRQRGLFINKLSSLLADFKERPLGLNQLS